MPSRKKNATLDAKVRERKVVRDRAPRGKVAKSRTQTPEEAAPTGSDATGEELYQRIDRLKEVYSERNAHDETWEKLYWMRRAESTREGEETIVSSKLFDAANKLVDMLSTHEPLIDVPPLDSAEDSAREAAKMERALRSAIYIIQRRSVRPVISQAVWDMGVLGRACARVTYIEKPEDELPLRLQVLDPKFVFPEFDEDGRLIAVAEIKDLRVGDIKKRLPGVKLYRTDGGVDSLDELDSDEMVEYAEWWDATRQVCFVGGREVYRLEPHGYGMLPYVFRYGRYVRSSNPSDEAVSIFKGAENIVSAYDRMLSTFATLVVANAFSAYNFISDRGEAYNPSTRPGAINYLLTGEEFKPIDKAIINPELERFIERLNKMVGDTTYADISGDMESGATSGYAMSQMTRAERGKINPVKQNMDFFLAGLFELMLSIIARAGEDITLEVPRIPGVSDFVYTEPITVSPDEAKKYRRVTVSIPPDFLQDMQVQVALAVQATASKLMDRDTARRKFMNEFDGDAIEGKLLFEQMVAALMQEQLKYGSTLLGIMNQPQMPPGAPGGAMPPNGGLPETTPPGGPGMSDSNAGVPPTQGQEPMSQANDAIGQQLGGGVPPGAAQALVAARGTPQSSGRGR